VPRRAPSAASFVLTAVLGAVAVVGLPLPSYAGAFSTYVTTVTKLAPAVRGVTAKAARDGESITVRNTSATPLVVDGYQGEAYLKITARGVWQNQLSPAVYLNKEQTIGNIPPSADAKKPPQWKKIADDNAATWHDHRIHWMGNVEPPAVQKDPDHEHLISNWKIPTALLTSNGHQRTGHIDGTLVYMPATKHLGAWITGGVIALAVVVLVGINLLYRRRRSRRLA